MQKIMSVFLDCWWYSAHSVDRLCECVHSPNHSPSPVSASTHPTTHPTTHRSLWVHPLTSPLTVPCECIYSPHHSASSVSDWVRRPLTSWSWFSSLREFFAVCAVCCPLMCTPPPPVSASSTHQLELVLQPARVLRRLRRMLPAHVHAAPPLWVRRPLTSWSWFSSLREFFAVCAVCCPLMCTPPICWLCCFILFSIWRSSAPISCCRSRSSSICCSTLAAHAERASRITRHASPSMHHPACIIHHPACITRHASPSMHH